jgi:hypothetical protein
VRVRVGPLFCLGISSLAVLWALEPRLTYTFPSMIDDWSAIANAPRQLREIVELGNPEDGRYRPGFILWNALQWHTLGAPAEFVGPQLWELGRVLLLVIGVTSLAALVTATSPSVKGVGVYRWLLVAGVPLASLTAPSLAIDLARFGPQEPLLVGGMSLGAVLLVWSMNQLLEPRRLSFAVIPVVAVGLLVWAFGVLQKETSCCVLLLAPFLWPTIRAQRERWSHSTRGPRIAIGLVAAATLLPFVPMAYRLAEFALVGEHFYEAEAARQGLLDDLSDQLSQASDMLHSPILPLLSVAAAALLAVDLFRNRIDWLSIGLLVVAFAFVVFAAETGVVASRYYLPSIVLTALVVARTALPLGTRAVVVAGVALVGVGAWQTYDANGWVQWWVDGERDRETLVRQAAGRSAGGCDIDVIGLNVELVVALPVLMPLADEPPHDCKPGERFMVVIDPGGAGTETPPDDPRLSACAPEPEPVWSSHIGKILRCTA